MGSRSPLTLFLLLGLGAFTATSIISARLVEKVYDSNTEDLRLLSSRPAPVVAVRELGEHEHIFRGTIKSCLPSEKPKCKTFLPNVDGQEEQRIAVISPPGYAPDAIYKQIERILQNERQGGETKSVLHPVVKAFVRHSVPLYGYGKTHGLTKIVRLVPQPLLLEVTGALQSMMQPEESHKNITLQDVKAALRQILRFHCRLSAVAAHTAQLSVDYLEMATDMSSVMTKLRHFLLPEVLSSLEAEELFQPEDQNMLFEAQLFYGKQLLSHVQRATESDVYRSLEQVLMEELTLSKNLTIWPCPSFWSVGDEPNPFEISPLVQRLAQALSPDCNDPFAECWVERDKCESKGDGLCNGSKR